MPNQDNYAKYLIEPEALIKRLDDKNLVVLDTTTMLPATGDGGYKRVPGIREFEAGHIPGAQFVDLEEDLSKPAEGLMFTLPGVDQFAEAAARFGIGEDSFVILYSTTQVGWATRVWLMLRAFGFENAVVLNGGFEGWVKAGGPVETGPARAPANVTKPFPFKDETSRYFVGTKEVETNQGKLVNALPPELFAGTADVFYGKPGHIPGSVNIPTGSVMDENGRYQSRQELIDHFKAVGIAENDKAIAYCGGGVAASNIAFSSLLAGYGDVKVYDGSMTEWAQNPKHEVVRGNQS